MQIGRSDPPRTVDRGPLSAVSGAVAALVREHWGRGPARCRAYWAGPDTLVVLFEDAQTVAERRLHERGHAATVLDTRRSLLEILEDDLRRIVTRATNRPVRAYLNATHLEPDICAMLFVLGEMARDEPLGPGVRRAIRDSDERAGR